jgi:hypothetical protein
MRVACTDTLRPEVMTAAYNALKTRSKMDEAFVEGLLSYYVSTSKEEQSGALADGLPPIAQRQWSSILDGYKLHYIKCMPLSTAAASESINNPHNATHAKFISTFYQRAAAREAAQNEHASTAPSKENHHKKKNKEHKEHKKKSKKPQRDKAATTPANGE